MSLEVTELQKYDLLVTEFVKNGCALVNWLYEVGAINYAFLICGRRDIFFL
jgi:hypothetical protein